MAKVKNILFFIIICQFSTPKSFAKELKSQINYDYTQNNYKIYSNENSRDNDDLKSDKDIHHSLALSLQKLNGRSDEIVFDKTKKLSHLEWDLRDIKMLALDYNVKFSELYSAKIKFANSIDHGSEKGRMVDSDWLGDGYDGNINHENWTHRSFSQIKVQRVRQIKLEGSLHLFRDELKLNLGYNRDNFKWRDYAGEYIYSSYNKNTGNITAFRDIKGNSGGVRSISYQQYFNTPYIGLSYQKELFDKTIFFNIFGNYSHLSSANTIDNHHLRNLEVKSSFRNGEYINWGANIYSKITNNLYLGGGYEYTYYPLNRGDAVYDYKDSNSKLNYNDGAGIRNKYSTFSLNLKYNFTTQTF